ncbi:ATP-binding protein [Amycolatopsis regifaucium]|uniref:Transcriptional regulator n=1 Tax=Amycolatopsis regifaucium TaxID=546365 RepID=A0A154ML55_9PSEU|nr:ATP-binding protein [Amycolatopsis regifaucium]KZB85016.1 transcriptional regulator [Amycolatopsis regifaucium]OKA04038.1 transcriptional regulator [Amycolatopsis regifaucium]SFH97023.1 ATP-dependent DNA helicase RecG [Amycolatopsis regifaucium]
MLHDELIEIIANLRALGGDHASVEAKRAETKLPKSVRETLSAFANTSGGVLIFGLDETRGFEATGVQEPAKLEADLAAMCSENLEPPLRPLIGTHRFEDADLVVAEIPELPPASKPAYNRGTGMTQGSFIRVADGDRKLSPYEVQLMVANRGQPRDDEQPVPGTTVTNLDEFLTASFLSRLRRHRGRAFANLDDTAALRRAKILVGDVLSLAGLLALGEYPQEFFPQLMLSFVHYPTKSGPDPRGTRFIDNVAAEGPIPVIVDEALIALRRNMKRRSTVRGAGRTEAWEYPETALREAVVNALVHRDYSGSSHGTQVQVEMYPDRLVIRNPGGLYGSVREENLGVEGTSSARNATLLKILEDTPLPGSDRPICENRGSGIPAMLAAMRDAKLSPPRFADDISTFKATFPNHTLLGDGAVQWIASLREHGLTDSQCHGLAMLFHGETLNNQVYRNANDLDSRVATEELGDLVARGLLVPTGGRRYAQYTLADDVVPTPADDTVSDRRRVDRREGLLLALGEKEATRADLVAATGLPDRTVSRWLSVLLRQGLIEATERNLRSPNVRYRRTPQRTLDETGVEG